MRLVFAVLSFLSSAPVLAAGLSDAQSLYDRNRIGEAEQAFAAVAADRDATSDDRSAAERQLARIAWLIDGDADRALAHLARAQAVGGEPCTSAAYEARVLHEAGRAREALERAPELLDACAGQDGIDAIRTRLIAARLDLAMADPGARPSLLAEAAAEGAKLGDRTEIEGARARLETAMLAGDSGAAIAAWKDYFWLEQQDAPQALLDLGATARFRAGLGAGASVADRLALAELLMRAGFTQASRRYSEVHGLQQAAADDPAWGKLTAYWQALDQVKAVELKVNRGLARGRRDEAALEDAAKAATIALMQAAGAGGDPPAVLREHYGLVGTVGETSGYPSIHMGHLIEDHADRVTQYGKSADIRFLVIDNMIGNGFESWLWDGSAMAGGWTANGAIVHIRPGYVRSPALAYRLTYDSPDRRRLIARQDRRAAADIAALKARPVATLEGLNDRLQLQLVDQIWKAARSRATDEADAKRLFLADYSRANLDQSIRVHEGRHAIDNAMGLKDNVDQAVLEYRAKLAELALTAYPRMALRNMNRSLEGEGPHDRAGARIFDNFRKWMEANPDRVIDYDRSVPALAQLDKLTDDQLREIARSLDPLAVAQDATASGGNPS